MGPSLLAVTCPLGTDHEAPAFSHWVLPCPLALSARHLAHALGTVYEAPTFSQWVPAFSQSHAILALTTRHHTLDNCKRTDFGNDHMVLSTVLTNRMALSRLSKSAPQTCPQRDQRLCAAHAHKRCSVALMLPKRTGWASSHTTLVLRQVFPRTPFKNEFAGINKARRMSPQENKSAHQPLDQESEETSSHFKWFLACGA